MVYSLHRPHYVLLLVLYERIGYNRNKDDLSVASLWKATVARWKWRIIESLRLISFVSCRPIRRIPLESWQTDGGRMSTRFFSSDSWSSLNAYTDSFSLSLCVSRPKLFLSLMAGRSVANNWFHIPPPSCCIDACLWLYMTRRRLKSSTMP